MGDHLSTTSSNHDYRPLSFDSLDATKRRLMHDNPGWNVWYVSHADRHIAWCAQPFPLLNEASPGALQAAMKEAEYVTRLSGGAL